MIDHLGINTTDMAAATEFYDTVPGEYHERYYGFVRDRDGNNVEAVCHTARPGD